MVAISIPPELDGQALEVKLRRLSEDFFEPRLIELGLGEEQIRGLTLDELQEALDRVNDAITNPQGFGEISVISFRGELVIAKASSDRQLTVGIMPLLLIRKRLILSRIRELGGQNAEQILEQLVQSGDGDEADRRAADQALQQLRTARSAQQQESQIDQELVRLNARAAVYERKARVVRSFLARESIASIAGGLLLLALAGTLIVAMFVGTKPTEVVANAFLIILGYFFGQSVARERDEVGRDAET